MVSIIVAVADNGVMGKAGAMLPWHLNGDLRHFKQLTTNHPIIMGRKTYETLPGALPNRRNIVVTRDHDFVADGVELAYSLEEALAMAKEAEETFVIGGANLIHQALPVADKMYITEVHGEPDGNVRLEMDRSKWKETSREPHPADEKNDYPYDFVELVRV